ncbi:hypothetical protein BDB00DRAFT_815895 [Zychaea mexicana]|uniref:uncharacterized protein n=1 Tax=Zychaea mexicana TaxID=64656 RepID=UPI0022FE3304|nr:uncharacterized protein BDB00DRAFT_815895 [Zychaea mexicana]KAI9495107.1 hypothetical protein BDB00DRAFT_815895 [Zychaea mexicana]
MDIYLLHFVVSTYLSLYFLHIALFLNVYRANQHLLTISLCSLYRGPISHFLTMSSKIRRYIL